MKLKVKDINLSSGGPLIAVIHEDDARKLDLFPLDRIKITRNDKNIVVVINIAEKDGLKPGYIGLFEEVIDEIKIKNNQIVDIEVVKKPESLEFIKKKLEGHRLNNDELYKIIKDAVDNKLSQIELTYFCILL